MSATQLISLNVLYRGTQYLGSPTQMGIDLEDIVAPIEEDLHTTGAASRFYYRESGSLNTVQNNNQGVLLYKVQESLTTIAASGTDMVKLTVTKRGLIEQNAQALQSVPMVFRATRFTGPIEASGTGAKFFYYEGTASEKVFYEVAEDISAIIGALPGGITGTLTPPYLPYAVQPSVLADSVLSFRDDGASVNIAIDEDSSIRSHVADLARISFTSTGDGMLATTDGGAQLEMVMSMEPTTMFMGFASSFGFSAFDYGSNTGEIYLTLDRVTPTASSYILLSKGDGVVAPTSVDIFCEGGAQITSDDLNNPGVWQISNIETGGFVDAVTYKSSGVNGASGTFLSQDGKTITISAGIITSIV